jgi:ribose transport system permease protein
MTKSKKMIIGTLPFVALIVLFAIFCGIVSSKGKEKPQICYETL